MKKRSLVFSALAALVTAGILAGCGNNYYFAGRVLPPSALANRVLIAVQNPSPSTRGFLQFVDGFYDIRQNYKDTIPSFSISGYSGALPVTIQNLPEEQLGVVYGAGDGSFTLIDYNKENARGAAASIGTPSSSIFMSRNQAWVVAATQLTRTITIFDKSANRNYSLGLPGVNRVSINPGGSVIFAFVENSNLVYYPRKLQASEITQYSGGPAHWPVNAVDCEPQNLPGMCLFQIGDSSGKAYTYFDRPTKAMFSSDGSQAYILNCGPECGGTSSGVTVLPTAPFIIYSGQQSGSVPAAPTTIPIPGGASNALLSSQTLYVTGEQLQPDGLFSGNLTVVNLANNAAGSPISISDSAPGQRTRMIMADDNTLWIGGIRCTQGERFATGQPFGCLTMFNTATNSVSMILPFQGDLTGIASLTGLHKIYIAEGGQVYIYSTKDGHAINNFYVTVTGTAYDVAYMDAITDANNTVY